MAEPNSGPPPARQRPGFLRGPAQPGKIEKARDTRRAISRLLPYLKPFLPGLGVVFVFVLLYTGMDLLGPYLMGVAIDRFVGGQDVPGLARIAALMLAVYLLSTAFQSTSDV